MEKMNIIKLTEAGKYIASRSSFRASNLWAVSQEDGGYIIYSYATCIYMEAGYNDGILINRLSERFSRSTSRHQAIIKRALNIK